MTTPTTTEKKLSELYELIEDIEIAMMTTRSPDGRLVTRPMETQTQAATTNGDLWFVTSIETHKVEEIVADPNVSLGYYDNSSREWVSVSGLATITQDRAKIRELYQDDWAMWFPNEGGSRDGSADDPRLALIFVDAESVHYMKSKFSQPRVLFEIAKGYVSGEMPDVGREETLSESELS